MLRIGLSLDRFIFRISRKSASSLLGEKTSIRLRTGGGIESEAKEARSQSESGSLTTLQRHAADGSLQVACLRPCQPSC